MKWLWNLYWNVTKLCKIKSNKVELLKGQKPITNVGVLGADAQGIVEGELIAVVVKDLKVENIMVKNQKININEKASSLIGNQFWNHFTLTIDWANDMLILDPQKDFEEDNLDFFELNIGPDHKENIIEILSKVKGIEKFKDVKLESQVLKINDQDVSNFSAQGICDFWEIEWPKFQEQEFLKLLFLQDGAEREITINKLP